MGIPLVEVSREQVRQLVVDRLKAPEHELKVTEITGVQVALFTATCVHNTILGRHRMDGQTLGGTRSLDPASLPFPLDVSTRDISRLAERTESIPIGLGSGMTDKYAGLFFMYRLLQREGFIGETEVQAVRRGGGKSFLLVRNLAEFKSLSPPEREAIFFQHADHIARLKGLHTTAVDMNTGTQDMDSVWKRLKQLGVPQYVACQSPDPPFNGTGDPSKNTGLGVWSAALATLDVLGIRAEEAAFLVQGLGHVGGPQTEVMGKSHPGITTIVLDTDPKKVEAAVENYRGQHIYVGDANDPFGEETKKIVAGRPLVFMPTAREHEVNDHALQRMAEAGVVVVCGAANNQFPFTADFRPDQRVAWDYEMAGITVVPDSEGNAGGIQHLEMARLGMPDKEIGELIIAGERLLTEDVLRRARQDRVPPMVAYQDLVVDVLTDYCFVDGITP